MSEFVCVDANIGVKWVIAEENSDLALALYHDSRLAGTQIVVPPHMTTEVTSAIRRQVARSLITTDEGSSAIVAFLDFSLASASPPQLHPTALSVAADLNQATAYDAHYVALAQIFGCDFWTADQRLLNALGGRLPFVRDLRTYQSATPTG